MSIQDKLPEWFERKHAIVGGVILLCLVAIVFVIGFGPSNDYTQSPVYNEDQQEGFTELQFAVWNATEGDTIVVNDTENAGTHVSEINNSVTIRSGQTWDGHQMPRTEVHIQSAFEEQFDITAPTRFERVTIAENRAGAYGFNATASVEFQNSIIAFESHSNYTVQNASRAEFTETQFRTTQNSNATLNFTNVDSVTMTDVTVEGMNGVKINLDNSTLTFDGQTVQEDVDTIYLCGGASTGVGEGSGLSTEPC